MTLLDIIKKFNTQENCMEFLVKIRWPTSITCPRCKNDTISKIQKRQKYQCLRCKYQFSATTQTIFHKTYIPLPKWFVAIYLICSSEVSPRQLSRDLNLPYKTAWSMYHRIRNNMKSKNFAEFCGLV